MKEMKFAIDLLTHLLHFICSKVAWYTNLLLISAILINCASFIGGSLKQNMCVRARVPQWVGSVSPH